MGLISPGGENLLDFLELRQVLSTYDGVLRDPLWWRQERPVPMRVARGPLGIPLPSMQGPKILCDKQVIPLSEGDNMFGRYNKGTVISHPIETSDPSMDRRHCIINVKRGYNGELTYTIRDNQSVTGTFVMNRILGNRERLLIEDGAIITLGATTLILHTPEGEE